MNPTTIVSIAAAIIFAACYIFCLHELITFSNIFKKIKDEEVKRFCMAGVKIHGGDSIAKNMAEKTWNKLHSCIEESRAHKALTILLRMTIYGVFADIVASISYGLATAVLDVKASWDVIWIIIIFHTCLVIGFYVWHWSQFDRYINIGTKEEFFKELDIEK